MDRNTIIAIVLSVIVIVVGMTLQTLFMEPQMAAAAASAEVSESADNTELMDLMKREGSIIYLKRNESDMLPVILRHGIPAFLDENDLEGSFHRVYERRDRIYTEYADLVIDLGSYGDKEAAAERTAALLREKGYV